jgi:hypothetical protein
MRERVTTVKRLTARVVPLTMPRLRKNELRLPAMPRRSRGTAPITLELFGDWKAAAPTPSRAMRMPMTKREEEEPRPAIAARTTALTRRPEMVSGRYVMRSDRAPNRGASTAVTTGYSDMSTPVSRTLKCLYVCR